MKISIYSVGGTIDKIYFDELSEYKIGGPSIREILANLNLNLEFTITSLLKKDSLDMTDKDRQTIKTSIEKDTNDRILITHGTDTMIDTAKNLASIQNKTIVLTGAMQPAGFKNSDAVFNVGCAVTTVQLAKPGVHIAMNGRVYDPFNVTKNRDLGQFM